MSACSARRLYRTEVLELFELQLLLSKLFVRERTLALLDAATGVRVSELLALRWNDVDFENLEARRHAIDLASGSRGGSQSSVQAVYSDPRIVAPITTGPGYFFDGTRRQNIARPQTVRVLQTVGQQWEALHPDGPRINVGAVGLTYGGPLPLKRKPGDTRPPFHKSHQHGIDMDIRPMRNDGKEEGVEISDPHYSRALTNELIELFRSQGILRVDKIFFNDRTLIDRNPGVQYEAGHDNHFHIRFIAP